MTILLPDQTGNEAQKTSCRTGIRSFSLG